MTAINRTWTACDDMSHTTQDWLKFATAPQSEKGVDVSLAEYRQLVDVFSANKFPICWESMFPSSFAQRDVMRLAAREAFQSDSLTLSTDQLADLEVSKSGGQYYDNVSAFLVGDNISIQYLWVNNDGEPGYYGLRTEYYGVNRRLSPETVAAVIARIDHDKIPKNAQPPQLFTGVMTSSEYQYVSSRWKAANGLDLEEKRAVKETKLLNDYGYTMRQYIAGVLKWDEVERVGVIAGLVPAQMVAGRQAMQEADSLLGQLRMYQVPSGVPVYVSTQKIPGIFNRLSELSQQYPYFILGVGDLSAKVFCQREYDAHITQLPAHVYTEELNLLFGFLKCTGLSPEAARDQLVASALNMLPPDHFEYQVSALQTTFGADVITSADAYEDLMLRKRQYDYSRTPREDMFEPIERQIGAAADTVWKYTGCIAEYGPFCSLLNQRLFE